MLKKILAYLTDQITQITAVIAAILALTAAIFPIAEPYQAHFWGVALVAVVLMLIEIRQKLVASGRHDAQSAKNFESMRNARPEIVRRIVAVAKGSGTGHVRILGGRVRSISELLREVKDELDKLPASEPLNLVLDVCFLSPRFIEGLILPGDLPAEAQRERGSRLARAVEAAIAEMKEALPVSSAKKRIVLNLYSYNEVPIVYGFLFGDSSLLWGTYNWDAKASDVSGPSSECFLREKGSQDYEPIAEWLSSRIDLIVNSSSQEVPNSIGSSNVSLLPAGVSNA